MWSLILSLACSVTVGLKLKAENDAAFLGLQEHKGFQPVHDAYVGHEGEENLVGKADVQKGHGKFKESLQQLDAIVAKEGQDWMNKAKKLKELETASTNGSQPSEKIQSLMDDFVSSLKSEEKQDYHAKEKVAFAETSQAAKQVSRGQFEIADAKSAADSKASLKKLASFLEHGNVFEHGSGANGTGMPMGLNPWELASGLADVTKSLFTYQKGRPSYLDPVSYQTGCAIADLYIGNGDTKAFKKRDEPYKDITPANYDKFEYPNICSKDDMYSNISKKIALWNKGPKGYKDGTFLSDYTVSGKQITKNYRYYPCRDAGWQGCDWVIMALPPHWRSGVFDTQAGPEVITVSGMLASMGLNVLVISETRRELDEKGDGVKEMEEDRMLYKDFKTLYGEIKAGKIGSGKKGPLDVFYGIGFSYGSSIALSALMEYGYISKAWVDSVVWDTRENVEELPIAAINKLSGITPGDDDSENLIKRMTRTMNHWSAKATADAAVGLMFACLENRNGWCMTDGFPKKECDSPDVMVKDVKSLTGKDVMLVFATPDPVQGPEQTQEAQKALAAKGATVTTWMPDVTAYVEEGCRTHAAMSLIDPCAYMVRMCQFFFEGGGLCVGPMMLGCTD